MIIEEKSTKLIIMMYELNLYIKLNKDSRLGLHILPITSVLHATSASIGPYYPIALACSSDSYTLILTYKKAKISSTKYRFVNFWL